MCSVWGRGKQTRKDHPWAKVKKDEDLDFNPISLPGPSWHTYVLGTLTAPHWLKPTGF